MLTIGSGVVQERPAGVDTCVMAVVESRAAAGGAHATAPGSPVGGYPPRGYPARVRRRVTSGSQRWAVVTQSVIMLVVLGLFCFLLAQDLESPYSEALAALWGVFAFSRIVNCWRFGLVYSDAGLLVYTSLRCHWLPWGSVTEVSESEIQRQNLPSLLLGGRQPVRVLRIHRRYRWPILARSTRGISERDLDAMRTIALRNGTTWNVGDDFEHRSRERGIWSLGRSTP
ncbi:MAG: hypothetical protein MUP67_04065 [Acidimicrobiia bacterium]|nr:hypothetical protein [Acidimicrobiia bacterium]